MRITADIPASGQTAQLSLRTTSAELPNQNEVDKVRVRPQLTARQKRPPLANPGGGFVLKQPDVSNVKPPPLGRQGLMQMDGPVVLFASPLVLGKPVKLGGSGTHEFFSLALPGLQPPLQMAFQ
jgi:hypothetical protein